MRLKGADLALRVDISGQVVDGSVLAWTSMETRMSVAAGVVVLGMIVVVLGITMIRVVLAVVAALSVIGLVLVAVVAVSIIVGLVLVAASMGRWFRLAVCWHARRHIFGRVGV